jgi:hypothetical protein
LGGKRKKQIKKKKESNKDNKSFLIGKITIASLKQ